MIKKILFICCLIHSAVIICGQTKIPTNSTEKNIVSNWAIANIQDFDEKNINNVVENTSSYFNQNQKNVKNIYLSDFNEVSVSLYQLFNDITFKNTFIASSIIEANKEQARKQKRRLHYVSNIYVVSDPKNPHNEGKVFTYRYGKKIFEMLKDCLLYTSDAADEV